MELTRGRKVAIVAGGAFLALVAWLLLHDPWSEFDETVAALEAEGFATTPEAFVGPLPPPEENGAPDLVAAVEWVDAELGPESSWDVTGPWDLGAAEPWQETATPEQIAALGAFLDRAAPFFERVDAALAKPRFVFPVVRMPDGWVDVSHAVTLQQRVNRLLAASAHGSREAAGRVRSAGRLLALGTRVESSNLIQAMVANATAAGGMDALRRPLRDGSSDAVAARSDLDHLLGRPALRRFPAAMRGELAFMLDRVLLYRAGGPPSGYSRATAFDPILDAVRGRTGGPRVIVSPTDLLEDLRMLAALGRSGSATRTEIAAVLEAPADRRSMLRVALATVVTRLTRGDTQRDLARLALAAAEHRERHGRWPSSFDDLAPLFPGGMPATSGDDRRLEMTAEGDGLRLRDTKLEGEDAADFDWLLRAR